MSNMYGTMQPSNNLWVGNNYSQTNRGMGNYPTYNQNSALPSFIQNSMWQPQSINNILQVMGPESAQAYQIGPDSHVILMDSNKPVFYIKRSDNTGYTETRAFEFQEIPLIQSSPQTKDIQLEPEYITKSEFEDFKKMIEDLVMKHE